MHKVNEIYGISLQFQNILLPGSIIGSKAVIGVYAYRLSMWKCRSSVTVIAGHRSSSGSACYRRGQCGTRSVNTIYKSNYIYAAEVLCLNFDDTSAYHGGDRHLNSVVAINDGIVLVTKNL